MANLNIDLSSPAVQRMLRSDHDVATGKREMVQLAGDAQTGLSSTLNLDNGKHEVVVVYKDQFLTVDVYLLPGEPPEIHLICPRCHKASRISGANKQVVFDPAADNPMRRRIAMAAPQDLVPICYLGRLSVEPFECTWEIGEDKHAKGSVHTGVSLCRQRLAIEDNRAQDA